MRKKGSAKKNTDIEIGPWFQFPLPKSQFFNLICFLCLVLEKIRDFGTLNFSFFFLSQNLPLFLQVFKAPTNNNNVNNNNNNNNLTSLVNLQKKMLQEAKITEERNSNGENDPEHLSEEERVDIRKPETMIVSHLFMNLGPK